VVARAIVDVLPANRVITSLIHVKIKDDQLFFLSQHLLNFSFLFTLYLGRKNVERSVRKTSRSSSFVAKEAGYSSWWRRPSSAQRCDGSPFPPPSWRYVVSYSYRNIRQLASGEGLDQWFEDLQKYEVTLV
jgi:hypothetical protein